MSFHVMYVFTKFDFVLRCSLINLAHLILYFVVQFSIILVILYFMFSLKVLITNLKITVIVFSLEHYPLATNNNFKYNKEITVLITFMKQLIVKL